jgi:hypothetical protein
MASVFTTMNACGGKAVSIFRAALNTNQKEVYDGITSARLHIYIVGLCLGLALAIGFIMMKSRTGQPIVSLISLCQLVSITQVVVYMYYMLAPKPELMVVNMANERQREKWAIAYRSMQVRYYSAFLMSVVSVGSAGYLACK